MGYVRTSKTVPENELESEVPAVANAEHLAQKECVLRVLKESIEKLKMSLVIPFMFENPITLRQCLDGTEYEKCVNLLEAYKKKEKLYNKSIPPHKNYHLITLIDTIQENSKALEILPDWLDNLSDKDKSLLEAFYTLQYITEHRLRRTAVSEITREKKLHQTYHDNELIKKNIVDLTAKLRSEKMNLRWKLAAKEGKIKKYEEDLAQKRRENNMIVKQEIAKSSRRIRTAHAASVLRQKELEEELERVKSAYEAMFKQNLHQEKEIRDEKNKLLLQLQSIIKKYDQNIFEKNKENMHLQEEYERQKKEFDEFMVEYHREELEYERIVTQKQEEERREHEEKVMFFMLNRAARIIQKYWRRYMRAKRKTSKKGKGGKGKKK